MKRKFLVLACVAALLCSLAACSLTQAQTITFVTQPQSVFVVGDPVDEEDLFRVDVVLTDGSTRNDVMPTVRGFDTSRTGVFTATVSYRGASIEFTYYVVESLDGDFLGGTGTENDPYLIANAEQFKNITSKGADQYFALVADIDFGGEKIDRGLILETFEGFLDGNGRTIRGLKADRTGYLFYSVKGSTFEDLVFEIDSPVTFANISVDNVGDTTNFTSITINGSKTTSDQNHGNFIGIAYGTINFKDCVNNASMKGTAAYLAPFVGGYANFDRNVAEPSWATKVTFDNCINNADIEAQSPGAFVGNYWNEFNTKNFGNETLGEYSYEFTNCQNNGRITGTTARANRIFGSAGVSDDSAILEGITNNGVYSQATNVEMIQFEGDELILDYSKLDTVDDVVLIKIQMEFRTVRGFAPDSIWSYETSRYNVVKSFAVGTGKVDTGFRNWSVVSGYNGDYASTDYPNLYSWPMNTDITFGESTINIKDEDIKEDEGNYPYVVIDGTNAYYFVYGDYYVINDAGWVKFLAFGYDANGNLVCSSSIKTNTQNEALLTNAQA